MKLASISPWFYIGSIGVGVLVGVLSKKWKIAVLVGYCIIIFSVAVLSRVSAEKHTNNFVVFYKYKQGINEQILANIIIFIPIGALLESITWKLLPIGFMFSVAIELSQLLFHRGMFDVDDIISNSLGIVIGVVSILLFTLSRRLFFPINSKL